MTKNDPTRNTSGPHAKHEPPTVCGAEPTTEITKDEIESFGKGNSPGDTDVRAGDKTKRKPAK